MRRQQATEKPMNAPSYSLPSRCRSMSHGQSQASHSDLVNHPSSSPSDHSSDGDDADLPPPTTSRRYDGATQYQSPHLEQPDMAPTLPLFVGLDYSQHAVQVCVLDPAGTALC